MKLGNINNSRYQRQTILPEVGEYGQLMLHEAKVLVIGAGGLGVPVLNYLAGAGIGKIGIVDGDRIEVSNLHRQTLYRTSDVGKFKAEVAAQLLYHLNDETEYSVYTERLDFSRALVIFRKYDLVVDCTDNYESRYAINDAAVILGKPVVSGALHMHEGQITSYNYENGPTYRCLFTNEDSLGFGCTELGVLGPLVGVVGSMLAMEVLKIVLQKGEVLSGKLLILNLLKNEQFILDYCKSEKAVMEAKERLMKEKTSWVVA